METKKELSYFRLKLENYLSEHFPEMLGDKPFITARADEALTTYCDAVAQGFSHPEAEREGNGLLCKIIKELYQIISKIIEQQKVTDMI